MLNKYPVTYVFFPFSILEKKRTDRLKQKSWRDGFGNYRNNSAVFTKS